MYWFAANLVLGVHTALFPVLIMGVVAAALSTLRQYPRLAVAFWVLFLISAVSQPLPSCILTDMEKWLRHHVDPAWSRTYSVQRVLLRELTGLDLQEQAFWWIGLALTIGAGYVFWKYHRDQARDLLAWLMRRSGGV